MKRVFPLLLLAACAGFDETKPLEKQGRLEGAVEAPTLGDAWIFLYPPGQGFPGSPVVPTYVSAVSAYRRHAGDQSYRFPAVDPNPYRLWGFVDVDQNFDPDVDVLSQPGAGDRIGEGVELNLQPGKTQTAQLRLPTLIDREPPAFHLEGVSGDDVALDAQPNATTQLILVADHLDRRLDPKKTGFAIGLVDADRDGDPDDVNGDRIPDLSLTLILRFLALPGQVKPGATVVVPVIVNPAPFLNVLNGSLTDVVVVDRLQAFVVPQAQELIQQAGKPDQITPIGQPPPGAYELVALTAHGQYWRLPNDLKGAVPSQGVRFHFDRVAP